MNDQSGAAIFTATGPGSVTSFVFSLLDVGSYSSGDEFGIYSYQTGTLAPIFDLSSIPSYLPTATIFFVDADVDGACDDVIVTGLTGVIGGTYIDFGSDVFGYYTTVSNTTLYTITFG